MYRSSQPEVFYQKGVLKNFAEFIEKPLCQSLFLIKFKALAWVCNLIKKETLAQVFSCEFYEICKNNFFIEYFRWLLLYVLQHK